MLNVGFVERHAVAVHHPVAQVNPVAGHADDPFHHVDAVLLRVRVQKHDNLAAPGITIRQQRPTHDVLGANWTRFTKTWSPISSVSSIELEGISNACTTNVMMNNPVTSTAASEERNSTAVSLGFSSAAGLLLLLGRRLLGFSFSSATLLSRLSSFFATLKVPVP
jgi:hypothetical protein